VAPERDAHHVPLDIQNGSRTTSTRSTTLKIRMCVGPGRAGQHPSPGLDLDLWNDARYAGILMRRVADGGSWIVHGFRDWGP
jgi:hypothetical protein